MPVALPRVIHPLRRVSQGDATSATIPPAPLLDPPLWVAIANALSATSRRGQIFFQRSTDLGYYIPVFWRIKLTPVRLLRAIQTPSRINKFTFRPLPPLGLPKKPPQEKREDKYRMISMRKIEKSFLAKRNKLEACTLLPQHSI